MDGNNILMERLSTEEIYRKLLDNGFTWFVLERHEEGPYSLGVTALRGMPQESTLFKGRWEDSEGLGAELTIDIPQGLTEDSPVFIEEALQHLVNMAEGDEGSEWTEDITEVDNLDHIDDLEDMTYVEALAPLFERPVDEDNVEEVTNG